MTFTATQALNDAMLVGGIAAILDVHTNPAYAVLYQGTTALVTVVFAKPAATLIDHELVFAQGELAGDMIVTQGDADTFELFNGAGTLLGSGDVTDAAGSGALKISGTLGTRLYAGARAILHELKFV